MLHGTKILQLEKVVMISCQSLAGDCSCVLFVEHLVDESTCIGGRVHPEEFTQHWRRVHLALVDESTLIEALF